MNFTHMYEDKYHATVLNMTLYILFVSQYVTMNMVSGEAGNYHSFGTLDSTPSLAVRDIQLAIDFRSNVP